MVYLPLWLPRVISIVVFRQTLSKIKGFRTSLCLQSICLNTRLEKLFQEEVKYREETSKREILLRLRL